MANGESVKGSREDYKTLLRYNMKSINQLGPGRPIKKMQEINKLLIG